MIGVRVFITAAEASGDRNAAGLAAALRRRVPDARIEGLGGPAMAAAGVRLHAETVGRAAMGLRAFARAGEVAGLLRRADRLYREHRPDLAVCVDSWTMNKHFAALAKRHGVPVLYYVAPQAWASREGRVRRMRRVVDRLACILPFEEAWFRARGVDATFVGHPLFDGLPSRRDAAKPQAAHVLDAPPVVGLLPGSRRSVTAANFPRMLAVADRVRAALGGATFLVPTTPATEGVVGPRVAGRPWVSAEAGAFDDALRRCDLAIAVSGTATLHAAAWGVPMLVVYAGNPLLWHAAGRWMIRTRTFAVVNLLAREATPPFGGADPADHLVPEFIPWHGSVAPVADAAVALLRDPAALGAQRSALLALVATLDRPGASDRAAELALDLIGRSR